MAIPEGMTPKQRFKLKKLGLMLREAALELESEALTYALEGDDVSAASNLGHSDAYTRVYRQLQEDFPEVFAS